MEITSGPGELRKLPAGGTIAQENTQPALDLDALLGGLRPVVKGLDGEQVNQISNAILELLQGEGGALSTIALGDRNVQPDLGDRYQVISRGDQATSTRCWGPSTRRVPSSMPAWTSCRSWSPGSRQGRDPIAGAIPPLASADNDLTDMLAEFAAAAAGRAREPPPAGDRARQPQGRGQRGHRTAGRELPAAQLARCVRVVLQLLHLRDHAEDSTGRRAATSSCRSAACRTCRRAGARKMDRDTRGRASSASRSWRASCSSHSATAACRSIRRASPTRPSSPTPAASRRVTTSTSPASRSAR